MEKPARRSIYGSRRGKVTGKRLRGFLREKMKILKLFRDFSYCPEEDLHISCLLSEAVLACFQLSRLLMGLGKGLAGSHLFSPTKCVSVRLSAGFL